MSRAAVKPINGFWTGRLSPIRAMYRVFRPAKVIRADVRDIVFEVSGKDGDVSSLDQLADVLGFHNGALVLRNCHIRGAVTFTLHQAEGVLVVQGMAGTVVRYEPPEMAA